MKVRSKIFRSTYKFWETMCEKATGFASGIPTENLIKISHSCSCSKTEGTISVWYRATD